MVAQVQRVGGGKEEVLGWAIYLSSVGCKNEVCVPAFTLEDISVARCYYGCKKMKMAVKKFDLWLSFT